MVDLFDINKEDAFSDCDSFNISMVPTEIGNLSDVLTSSYAFFYSDVDVQKYSSAIEEDASMLLTHAFHQTTNNETINTMVFSDSTTPETLDKDIDEPIIDSNFVGHKNIDDLNTENSNGRYLLPIVEVQTVDRGKPKLLQKMIKNEKNCFKCEEKDEYGCSRQYLKFKNCDICSTKSPFFTCYRHLNMINCCRRNIFHSLLYTMGDENSRDLVVAINEYNNSISRIISLPLKSSFDKIIFQPFDLNKNYPNGITLKDKCKLLWRKTYHKNNTPPHHGYLCDCIEEKVGRCRKLLNYLLNVIKNLMKIFPGYRLPTEPIFESNANPFSYDIYPQLSKLYARLFSAVKDIDFIVSYLETNFHAMLPPSLKSNFLNCFLLFDKLKTFSTYHTILTCNNDDFRKDHEINKQLFQHYNTIDKYDTKNFHYCKHFPTNEELNELLELINSIYNNLLFGPFILNFCMLVFCKKLSNSQIYVTGFDYSTIPSNIWDHPFPEFFENMDSIVVSLVPYCVDR